jgi:hypothetical protein
MQEGRGIGEGGAGWRPMIARLALALAALLVPRAAPAIVGHYGAGGPNARDFFVPPDPASTMPSTTSSTRPTRSGTATGTRWII